MAILSESIYEIKIRWSNELSSFIFHASCTKCMLDPILRIQ